MLFNANHVSLGCEAHDAQLLGVPSSTPLLAYVLEVPSELYFCGMRDGFLSLLTIKHIVNITHFLR